MTARLNLVLLFILGLGTLPHSSKGQPAAELQFLAYEKIPAWIGVASQWQTPSPIIHFFDPGQYGGHADFVSQGLKTGIRFKQFKEEVSHPASRQYVPFFIYDLSTSPIEVNGTLYHWALHVEDYSYTDSPQELQETVLRLLTLLTQEMGPSRGLVLLATNPDVRPNTQMADALRKSGFPHLTRSQMLERAGSAPIQILNPGTTYGRLRYVKAGEEKTLVPDRNDILVFEQLPKRIFPVRGIIALEPQHPLSHVNLLAKNRGTINLSVNALQQIPNAENLLGQWVKLECQSKRVTLSPTTLTQAEAFWSHHHLALEIPAPLNLPREVVNLSTANVNTRSLPNVGAKAANYAQLLAWCHSGIIDSHLVQPALALPFGWYLGFMKDNQLNVAVDSLVMKYASMQPEERQQRLKALRDRIKNGKLPEDLLPALRAQAQQLDCSRIRLRSSTNCEDLPDFNGAGLYESKGFDLEDADEQLARKIKQVYASLWSLEAYEERNYFGIDHRKAAIALLISPAFQNEYANGVLITIPTSSTFQYQVNSQYGENSVSNPKGGATSEALLFDPTFSLSKIQSSSSIHPIFLDSALAPTLQSLLQTSSVLHRQFVTEKDRYGIDIEFKVMREDEQFQLYIKQIRLIQNQALPE